MRFCIYERVLNTRLYICMIDRNFDGIQLFLLTQTVPFYICYVPRRLNAILLTLVLTTLFDRIPVRDCLCSRTYLYSLTPEFIFTDERYHYAPIHYIHVAISTIANVPVFVVFHNWNTFDWNFIGIQYSRLLSTATNSIHQRLTAFLLSEYILD